MYTVLPLLDTPERALIMETLVRKTCKFDTAFTDYESSCELNCLEERSLPDFCEKCKHRLSVVGLALFSSLCWEVWRDDTLVGLVRMSNIIPGEDALGHYIFFDRNLKGKTAAIQEVIDWAFEEHEGWEPLQRLTIMVPDFAFALLRHASRKLGFGGPFEYTNSKGKKIPVEGIRRNAVVWRGKRRDMLQLGLLNPRLL